MTRVVFAVAALAASFALKHYANKMLDKKIEAKFREVLNKKAAEQNAPAN